MKQDLLHKNKIVGYILPKQEILLLLLVIIILSIPLVLNFVHQKPLLMGAESYYHLLYKPFSFLLSHIPFSFLFVVPLLLGLGSVLLLFLLARRFHLSPQYRFFFLLFLILTPSFIYSFSTISAYAGYFFLVLAGFTLLTSSGSWRYLSFIPFVLATTIDVFSGGLLLLLQLFYLWYHQKDIKALVSLGITALSFLGTIFIWEIPVVIGPFHVEHRILDLVSDLGGLSGVGFILLLLSFIGLGVLWRKKEFRIVYALVLFTMAGYIYSTETVLFLAVTLLFLATCGFIALFEQTWNLPVLKNFTFLLIMLSMVFSVLTYVDRVSDNPPTVEDANALLWIRDHTAPDALIFSEAENGYFIRYFAQREAFQEFHNQEPKAELAGTIMNSTYIATTFPLLEEQRIKYIYLTPSFKKQLPAEQGLLFLLSNERFKLVYSSQGYEVWEFKKDTVEATS